MIPEELYRTLMLATTAKEAAVAHEHGMPQNPASALNSTHAQMERELRQQQQQLVPQKRSKRKRKEALNAGDVIASEDDGGGGVGGADGQQIRFTGAYKRYRKLLQDERDRPQPVQIQNLPDLEESVSSALRRKTPAEEAAAATIVKVKKQTTRKKKSVLLVIVVFVMRRGKRKRMKFLIVQVKNIRVKKHHKNRQPTTIMRHLNMCNKGERMC